MCYFHPSMRWHTKPADMTHCIAMTSMFFALMTYLLDLWSDLPAHPAPAPAGWKSITLKLNTGQPKNMNWD